MSGVADELAELERIVKTDEHSDSGACVSSKFLENGSEGQDGAVTEATEMVSETFDLPDFVDTATDRSGDSCSKLVIDFSPIKEDAAKSEMSDVEQDVSNIVARLSSLTDMATDNRLDSTTEEKTETSRPNTPEMRQITPDIKESDENEVVLDDREVAEMSNIPKSIDDKPKPPNVIRPFRIILPRAPQSLIDACRTPPVKKYAARQRGNSNSSSRSRRRPTPKQPAARGSGKRGRGGSRAATKGKRPSKTPEPRGRTVSPPPAALSSSSSSSSDSEDETEVSPGKSDLLKKLTIKYKNAGATNLAKPPPAPPVRRPPSVEAKLATPGSSDSESSRKSKGGKEKRKNKEKQRRPRERGDLKEHRKKRESEEHSHHHDRKGTGNNERMHDRPSVKKKSKNDEQGKKVNSNKPLAVRHASKVVSPVAVKNEELFTVVERPSIVSTPVRSAPRPEAPKHDSPFEKRKGEARKAKFPEAVESVVDLVLRELLDGVCGPEPAKEAAKRKLSGDDRSLPMKKRHISGSEVTVALSQSNAEDIDDRDTPFRTLWIEVPRLLSRHIEHIKKRCRREAKEVQPSQFDEVRHKKDKREEERKSCIADDGTKPRLHPSQKIKKLLEEKASHLKHRNVSTDSPRVSVDRQLPDSSDDDAAASVKEEKASPTGEEDAKQEKRMSFVPLPFLKKADGRSVKKLAKEREEQQSHKAPPVVVQAASGPTANKIPKPHHKQKGAKEEEKTRYSAYVPASTGPLPRKKGNYTSSQAILMENRHKTSSWSSANDILKNILDGSTESMKLIKHKASSKEKGAESGEKSRFEKLSVSEGASGQLPVAKVKPFGSPPVSASQSTGLAEVASAPSGSAANQKATGAFLEGLRNAGETAEAVKLEERYASPLEKKRMSMLGSEAKFRSGAGFYPRPQNRGRGRGGFPSGRRDPGLSGEPSSKDSLVESFMDHFKSLRDESGTSDIQSIAMRAADRFRAGQPWRDGRGASLTNDRNGIPNYASGPVLSGDGSAAKRIPGAGARPDTHRGKGPAGPPQPGWGDDDDFDDGGGGGDDSPTLSTIEGETDLKRMADMGLPVQFGGPNEDDEAGGFRGSETRGRGRGRFPEEGRGFRGGRGGLRGGRGRGGFVDEPDGFDRRDRGSFRGQGRGRYNSSRGFGGYGDYVRPRYEGREDPRQANRRERFRDDGAPWDGSNKPSRGEAQDDNYKRFLSSSRNSSSGKYGAFSRSDRRRSRSRSRSKSRSRSRRRSKSRSRSRSRGNKSPRDHPQPGLDDLLKNIVGLDTPSSSRSDAKGQDAGAPGYLSQLLAGSPVKPTTSAQAKSTLPVQDFPPDLAQDILQLAATDPGALLNLIETGGPQVTELLCKVVASADKPVSQEAASILQNRLTESEKPKPVSPPQPGPSHKPPQPEPLSGPAQSVLELFGGFTGNILPPPIFTAPPEETTPAPPPPQPAAASGGEEREQAREHINQLIDLFQQILGFPGSIIHMDLEKKNKVSSMIPLLVSLREVAHLPGTGDTFDILPDIAQFAMALIAEPGMLQ